MWHARRCASIRRLRSAESGEPRCVEIEALVVGDVEREDDEQEPEDLLALADGGREERHADGCDLPDCPGIDAPGRPELSWECERERARVESGAADGHIGTDEQALATDRGGGGEIFDALARE